jgi:hypothetical protein
MNKKIIIFIGFAIVLYSCTMFREYIKLNSKDPFIIGCTTRSAIYIRSDKENIDTIKTNRFLNNKKK